MTLRERLRQLHTERSDLHEARGDLNQRIGEALLEASEAPHVTLTEACQLIGLSRQMGYRLLRQAEKRRNP